MAVDRLLPVSTTPGAVSGNAYMDAVQEEVGGLWDRAIIRLASIGGTPNAITATFVPALTAGLVDGMNAVLVPISSNTGAVTLNGVPVVDGAGNALTSGRLFPGTWLLTYVAAATAWSIVGYFPGTGGPGQKLINSIPAANFSSIDFIHGVGSTIFDSTYDTYRVIISKLVPATNDVELWLRFGTGAGPTFQTSSYSWAQIGLDVVNGARTLVNNATDTHINLGCDTTGGRAISNTFNISGYVDIPMPADGGLHTCNYHMSYGAATTSLSTASGGACWTQGTPLTALRFMFESGNILTGRITLYGFTKV